MPEDFAAFVERARARACPEVDVASLRGLAPAIPVDAPFARRVLFSGPTGEVSLLACREGAVTPFFDQGAAHGIALVVSGALAIDRAHYCRSGLEVGDTTTVVEGEHLVVDATRIHRLRAQGPSVLLSVRGPKPRGVRTFDVAAGRIDVLHDCADPTSVVAADVRSVERLADVAAGRSRAIRLVVHTTAYREGSEAFARAARTLASERSAGDDGDEVELRAVTTKRDFVGLVESLAEEGRTLRELHFVGHSGMYGPMFGSTAFPEQLSPHEWRTLRAPFAGDGRAVFHACRSGRWFAPFVARTLGVRAEGYHGYTTVSRAKERYAWDTPFGRGGRPLHVIACEGRKSHGLAGALRKHAGLARAESMRAFEPVPVDESPSYDAVATSYAEVFRDLRVRAAELAFVERALTPLGPSLRLLDLGCGPGTLFDALGSKIRSGVGLDASQAMVAIARRTHAHRPELAFERARSPELPFPDASFDAVVSFLSMRYLDWDPIVREVARVLRRGGRFVVVDMVDKPLEVRELPLFVRSAIAHARSRVERPGYHAALRALTERPAWARMLDYNPIRAEHEYRWYLESRFPGRRLEVLTASRTARVVAFDSGPKDGTWRLTDMVYP